MVKKTIYVYNGKKDNLSVVILNYLMGCIRMKHLKFCMKMKNLMVFIYMKHFTFERYMYEQGPMKTFWIPAYLELIDAYELRRVYDMNLLRYVQPESI